MSEKVIVNKVVAGWVELGNKKAKNEGLQHNKASVLSYVTETLSKDDLENQNCDIVTLAKAIQYGYEVPYEFKVGDIVFSHYTNGIYEITKSQKENRFPNASLEDVNDASLEDVNARRGQYTLICKAENREDLK